MISKKRIWLLALVPCAIAALITVRLLVSEKAVHAKSSGDVITVAVYPGGVYLAPSGGDILQWIRADDPNADVFVHFVGSSPCRGKKMDTDICIIRNDASGTFRYYCTDQKTGGTVLCKDPGVDPNSSVGPDRYAHLTARAAAAPPGAAPAAGAAPAPVTHAPAADAVFSLSCESNRLVLYYDESTPPEKADATKTYNVRKGFAVEWDYDAALNPSITTSQPTVCTPSPVGQALACIVPQNATPGTFSFTVTSPGCRNTSVTTNIQVQ